MKRDPPICNVTRKLPFIPIEKEIDTLIAGTGKKMAALLQLFKETAMRIGEASKIRWKDLDPKQNVIRIRDDKNSNPRIFHISNKLLNMLNTVPKKDEYIFNSNPKVLEYTSSH